MKNGAFPNEPLNVNKKVLKTVLLMKYANITKCKKNDKGVHHCRPLPLIRTYRLYLMPLT